MKIDEHPYADEFTKETTLLEFYKWVLDNLYRFALNLVRHEFYPRPIYEWLEMFLLWSEYSDFMKWKQECEKNDN